MTPLQWQTLLPWVFVEAALLALAIGTGADLYSFWRWRRENRRRCAEEDRLLDIADCEADAAGRPRRPRFPRNMDELGGPVP